MKDCMTCIKRDECPQAPIMSYSKSPLPCFQSVKSKQHLNKNTKCEKCGNLVRYGVAVIGNLHAVCRGECDGGIVGNNNFMEDIIKERDIKIENIPVAFYCTNCLIRALADLEDSFANEIKEDKVIIQIEQKAW